MTQDPSETPHSTSESAGALLKQDVSPEVPKGTRSRRAPIAVPLLLAAAGFAILIAGVNVRIADDYRITSPNGEVGVISAEKLESIAGDLIPVSTEEKAARAEKRSTKTTLIVIGLSSLAGAVGFFIPRLLNAAATAPALPQPKQTQSVASDMPIEADLRQFRNSRFYVQRRGGSDFAGPFEAAELASKLTKGELRSDDLAIESVGQSMGQLKNTRADQCTPLGKMFSNRTHLQKT
jgi:hypothetical protein